MYIITWTIIFVQGIVSDQSSNPNLFITNSALVMLMGSALGIIKLVHSFIFLNEVLGTLNSFTCFHSLQSMYNYSVHILWWRTRSDVDGKSMCFWSHITRLGMLHWPFVCMMQSFATCPRCCNKGILLQDAESIPFTGLMPGISMITQIWQTSFSCCCFCGKVLPHSEAKIPWRTVCEKGQTLCCVWKLFFIYLDSESVRK